MALDATLAGAMVLLCEAVPLGAKSVPPEAEETVIVPPVAETADKAPAAEAPMAFVTPIVADVALLVNVAVTTATTPLEMVVELRPEAMHVYAVAPPAHEMDLPDAVATAPAATLKLAILTVG
jgi:hypothetical protein